MNLDMHALSVPTFVRFLSALDHILDQAVAFAESKKSSTSINVDEALTRSRLAADMFDLAKQVQIATDMAKGCAARLAAVEIPKYEDTESNLLELKARLAKTIAFVQSVPASSFADAAAREIKIVYPSMTLEFSGKDYLFGHVLPNFYFHITTAYNILRHNGVSVGKQDFLKK